MSEKQDAAEKTLAEIVGGIDILTGAKKGGWDQANMVAREVRARCQQSECLKVFDELERKIETMGIATRFPRDRFFNQGAVLDDTNPGLASADLTRGRVDYLNVAGHERAILQDRLRSIRHSLGIVFSELETLCMEVEAANTNDDGTHAEAPSPETLRDGDLWQPPQKRP